MTDNIIQFLKTNGGIPIVEKITDKYFDDLDTYTYLLVLIIGYALETYRTRSLTLNLKNLLK